jgi:hypothetical protein
MKPNKLSYQNIFVVGSKPDAIFPEVKPDLVISANSAIKRVQKYYGQVPVISIMSDQVFSDNVIKGEEGYLNDVREYIKGSKTNELVILKTLPKYRIIKKYIDYIEYTKSKSFTRWEYHKMTINYVSIYDAIESSFQNDSFLFILKTIYQTVRYGKFNPLEISTGMISLVYALFNYKYQKIYIIGIGVNQCSGYSYSNNSVYNYFHVPRDILLFKSLAKKNLLKKLAFTDPYVKELVSDWS